MLCGLLEAEYAEMTTPASGARAWQAFPATGDITTPAAKTATLDPCRRSVSRMARCFPVLDILDFKKVFNKTAALLSRIFHIRDQEHSNV
jgi:hypothetical protein